MTENATNTGSEKKIVIRPNGSYKVYGNIPLCRKVQVVSEYGEPLTWNKTEDIKTEETYSLCRCGQSQNKPFCDGTHRKVGFDGTETADPGPTAARQQAVRGGTHIAVKFDASLCMNSGFCGTRLADIHGMMSETVEPKIRSLVMAMVERCPAGAYVYAINKGDPDIEPDLPQQIALTTEITSDGPIEGPLWVTGNIPIERSDGQPFETRNRVTLCNCGKSCNKPLCDGTHRNGH
jgi:CDGSH-type Zn-finger protein